MLIILTIIVWVYSFIAMPKEAAPAIKVPFFSISVVYPGADPETVEKQVIQRLESNLQSVSGIKQLESVSAYNIWVVSIQFARDKDITEAYNDLQSVIDKSKADFPDQAKEPILKRVDIVDEPIYVFSVVGQYLPYVLYQKVDFLEDKLKAIQWVQDVVVVGKQLPEVKIKFDYNKLIQYNINFSYAVNTIQTYIDKMPADKKDIDNNLYTVTLRTYPDQLDKLKQFLENLYIINADWKTISLSQIATITIWPKQARKESFVYDNNQSFAAITYQVKKTPWADILQVIDNVKKVLQDPYFKKNWLKIYEIASQKERITSTFFTFIENFWQTTLIIFVVILLFIGFKESVGISLAFPLVYLLTFGFLISIWYTFNNIVSFSLILTLWIMVDNLIVVIEWFEEWINKWLEKWEALYFSIKTYWKSIISWNLTTVAMFAPIWFMLSWVMGDFMKYMPVTVNTVLIFSMFVALIFLPVILSSFNFKQKPVSTKPNILFVWLKPFFSLSVRFYKTTVLIFVLLFISAIFVFKNYLKVDFLPPVDTNNIYVNLKFAPTTTLEENKKISAQIAYKIWQFFAENKWLLEYISINIWDYKTKNPLDNVVYQNSFQPDLSYINIKLIDKDNRNIVSYDIMQKLKKYLNKNLFPPLLTDIEVFINKAGPSKWKDVNFYLEWNNLKDLIAFYKAIENKLKQIPWTFDWTNWLEYTLGKLEIVYDIDKLKQFNITPSEIDLLIWAIQTSNIYEPEWITLKKLNDYGDDLVDVKAYIFNKTDKLSLLNMQIPGRNIYLKQIVKQIKLKPEIKKISHVNWKLVLNVWAYKTKTTSLGEITSQIEKIVEQQRKTMPQITMSYGWDVKDMKNSAVDLLKAFVLGIILMFSVLVLHFGNFRQPFLVLSVIPLLLIWAFWTLFFAWYTFSFAAQLGMFGLMWVWVNDAILLIERFNETKKNTTKNIDQILLDVVHARLKPVLMTTITTILGLMTLILKDELWGWLALAFAGWLMVGTMIILVYIPAMLKWGGK